MCVGTVDPGTGATLLTQYTRIGIFNTPLLEEILRREKGVHRVVVDVR